MWPMLLLKFPWLSVVGGAIGAAAGFLLRWVSVPMLVLLLAAGWVVWDTITVNGLRATVKAQVAQIEELEAGLVACKEASASNVEAVYALQRKLVECVGTKAAFDEANEAIGKVQTGYAQSIRLEVQRMREERDALYQQDVACGLHRVQPVCVALDGRLRRQGADSR